MKWISNGDPPQYVWEGDTWYNQKDKIEYWASIPGRNWWACNAIDIAFPKKTKIMNAFQMPFRTVCRKNAPEPIPEAHKENALQ